MICGKLPYALYFQDLFINKPVWMILPLSTGGFVKLSFHGFSHYGGKHFLKAVDNLFIMFTNVCFGLRPPVFAIIGKWALAHRSFLSVCNTAPVPPAAHSFLPCQKRMGRKEAL